MNDENDIVLDKDEGLADSVVAEESQAEAIKKLREKLKGAEVKAKEYLDKWQRAQADFVNLRKQDEESKAEFLKYAGAGVILQILPVLDSLSLAVSHGSRDCEVVLSQLLKILKDVGVEEINPLGETFNPNLHEAIGMQETKNQEEDHKILDVLQKGYMIRGKTLRPARVRVGELNNQ